MPSYYSDGTLIHLSDPLTEEYTLCGDSLECASDCALPQCNEVPQQAVTCKRCLEIIADCVEYAKQKGKTNGND